MVNPSKSYDILHLSIVTVTTDDYAESLGTVCRFVSVPHRTTPLDLRGDIKFALFDHGYLAQLTFPFYITP